MSSRKSPVTSESMDEVLKQIRDLTGHKYYVRKEHGGKNSSLVTFEEERELAVQVGVSLRPLYDWAVAFLSGVQAAQAGKNPDLKDPVKALKRIGRELNALHSAVPEDGGEYPAGYEQNINKAEIAVNKAQDYAKGGSVDA